MAEEQELGAMTLLTTDDLHWFMESGFFDAIPEDAKARLFGAARLLNLKEGERLIRQGDDGDCFYILREGKCVASIEKEGQSIAIGRLRGGDIVGEMALLTGEPRSAHVDAETDAVVWQIGRDAFEKTCAEHPDLRKFLTNVLLKRFSLALVRKDLTIGKYHVDKVLGQGGSSVVYQGTHAVLGMPVAVKMLKHHRAMEPAFVDQFRNEAKAIAQLNHENIVKVYDIEELYRTFFIVMEHVEGRSLRYVLGGAQRQLMARLFDYLLQIGAGLAHAHEKGVVHRDIKPGNVLIQEPGDKVKIVDFGLACPPGHQEKNIQGSPWYLSPEQIKLEPVDERSDIYSLGIMAYEMFTGECPRKGNVLTEILCQHVQTDVEDPRKLAPDTPEDLANCIIKATRRNPSERYQTVKDILYDLEPLASKMGITSRRETKNQLNMMSLYLFYRGDHRQVMRQLVREFSRELEKVGARLRGAHYDNIDE